MGLPVAVSLPPGEGAPQPERRQASRRKHRKAKESKAAPEPEERPEPLEAASAPEPPSRSPPPSPPTPPSPLSPPSPAERLADALPSLHLTNGTNGGFEHSPPSSPAPSRVPAPAPCELCGSPECATPDDIRFESYRSELQMADVMKLIQKDLSEPYSIYTYRYFIHNWPKLCFLAVHDAKCVGAIVCKLDLHRTVKRGYIAMLAVDEKYRKRKIGSKLVTQAIMVMISDKADEVVLETEITNKPALRLYENLGFVRDKRLFRYYLNGVDALRLKLWLR